MTRRMMKIRKCACCIMSPPQCKCVFIFRVNAPNHDEQKKIMFLHIWDRHLYHMNIKPS